MPLYKVRLYRGADRPAVHPQDIIADDARQAAEKACGERLALNRRPLEYLRATVRLPDGQMWAFFADVP
jgi:hypothetical protein